MDLIDKIKSILKKTELKAPIFDIHYDNQGNVVGYVADIVFEEKNQAESQKIIWDALQKNLGGEELIRILVIFNETLRERSNRLSGAAPKTLNHSNFWIHVTPELSKYWLFIDVAKINEDYKSFFLIINQKENYKNGLIFSYPKDVIDFMELGQNEIYDELYSNTFNNAESEIKIQIMNKHEALTQKGLWGKDNIYNYVFERFELKPQFKIDLIFTNEEIKMLDDALGNYKEFKITKDLIVSAQRSKAINDLKTQYR